MSIDFSLNAEESQKKKKKKKKKDKLTIFATSTARISFTCMVAFSKSQNSPVILSWGQISPTPVEV